jgi:short-subunit dehydrogenase
MIELNGGLALITGASRGLGEKLAYALANKGMRLLLTARSDQDLETVATRLRAKNTEVHTIAADISDRAQREALVRFAEAELGGLRLLVNNAGIERIAKYETVTTDDVEQVLNVNLFAPMHLTRLALVGMQRRGSGHILNMASMAGMFGVAHGETYSATKHGLVGFTRALRASAREENTGVSASVVCPSFVTDVGLYHELQRRHGAETTSLFPPVHSRDVVNAALKAIENDLPDVLVTVGPIRLGLAVNSLSPRLGEFVGRQIGSNKVFSQVANRRHKNQSD